ncbi:hypothetical protein EI77_00901 [Prosthecobacter fusiformis]|uniref:Uncharacterized protein n=1 Tax=Prosthecobacter fusiformis TaxID=48464 RepID=A0A4R7SR66_9BACT|nr:hypothetical protein [Prosthecobacter fusiformis]TDU81591.1 hypothetical protein EI77_00901 [Prosthecobacter fusiformis]
MKRLLLLVIFASQAQAQKSITDEVLNEADGTRLEIRSVFDPLPPSGYAPMRIVATNGSLQDGLWDFTFGSETQDYRRNNLHTSRLNLPVPARSTQSALFLVPLAPDYGSTTTYRNSAHQLQITLNGPAQRSFSEHSNRTIDFPAIALSKTLADNSLDGLNDEVEQKNKTKSGYSSGANVFGSRFLPEEVPEDWLGVSGFDYVMLTDTDWQVMKPGSRNALLQWTRLGGRLHFYCKSEKPGNLPADSPAYGLGKIETFRWNGSKMPASETVSRYWNGSQRLQALFSEHTTYSDWPLLQALGKRSFNSWQVIVFLAIFGILVGPVNLFVLAPAGRRHRLFVTTPLLSLGASVVMVGIILFQDGIGGTGARSVFIELEPEEAAAYVTQKQVSRTGVLLGAGFDARQPSLIEPLTLPDSEWVKLKNTHDAQPVNLTHNGASRGGNFFQSRTEQGQLIRAVISTRARLEVTPAPSPDEAPSVVSALGFTVQEMYYADANGGLWTLASPLATGQKAALSKAEPEQLRTWWKAHQKAVKIAGLQELVVTPQNEFFAAAQSAPDFTQDTLSSIRWQEDKIIVHGSVTPP